MTDYFTERYKFTHRIEGMAHATGDEIAEILEGALEKVTGKIIALEAKAEKTRSYTRKKDYLQKQRKELEKVLIPTYQEIIKEIEAKALELAGAAPGMIDTLIKNTGIVVQLGVPNLNKKTVQAWFDSSQIEGTFFTDYLAKLESNAAARIIRATRESIVQHESIRETAKRLRNVLNIGRKSAEGLAQTSFFHAANFAERSLWAENQERLKGLRYVTELDRRTCPQCAPNDGRVFSIDEAPQPPLHMRCRCHLEPIFKNEKLNEFISEQPRIARIETEPRTVKHQASTGGGTSTAYRDLRVGFPKRKITHSEWMESMVNSKDKRDRDFALEALGARRFALIRRGRLKTQSLYYRGKLRTIKELEEALAK